MAMTYDVTLLHEKKSILLYTVFGFFLYSIFSFYLSNLWKCLHFHATSNMGMIDNETKLDCIYTICFIGASYPYTYIQLHASLSHTSTKYHRIYHGPCTLRGWVFHGKGSSTRIRYTTAHDDWTNLRAKIVDVGSTDKLNLSQPVSSHKEWVVSSGLGVKESLQSLAIVVSPSEGVVQCSIMLEYLVNKCEQSTDVSMYVICLLMRMTVLDRTITQFR